MGSVWSFLILLNALKWLNIGVGALKFGLKSLNLGAEALKFGLKSLNLGVESLKFGPKSLNATLKGYYLIPCSFFIRSISGARSSRTVPFHGLTPAMYEERVIICPPTGPVMNKNKIPSKIRGLK